MMKKYIFMAAAAMAALSSCSDNEVIAENTIANNNDIVKKSLVFTATMEGAPQTRATFDNTFKCASWEAGDLISINGNPFNAGSAGTSTTFKEIVEERPTFVHSYSNGFWGEGPEMLVDEDGTETKWCANTDHKNANDPWDIIVKTDGPTQLQAIKLWNGDDTWETDGRRWKNVKVWGWTSSTWDEDASDWEEIKTFQNLDLAYDENDLFAGTLEVNATKKYEYYKVEVLDNEWGDIMQMSDMKFVYLGGSGYAAPFHAYFPAALYDGTTATLPANITEEWADGRFNMPMYAESATTNLQFKNLCGVLKITVKSDDLASVRSIKVSSSNCATSGKFTVNEEGAAVLITPTDVSQIVTVTYTTPVETTAEGKVFYVAIPAQTYQDLKIRISDGANDKFMVTKSGADIVVERNKIYPIDFGGNYEATLYRGTQTATIGGGDVDVPWVQLWEGGPKFAAYNVGVTDANPASYGGYYTWGGTQDKNNDADDYYKDGGDLPAEYDTATNLWGSNWRMPTSDELQRLIDNCDVEKNVVIGNHIGTRFTGKGAYADYSLYLPAAGRCQYGNVDSDYDVNGPEGYWSGGYWSTNKYIGFYAAWTLYQNKETIVVSAQQQDYGYSVRAVVKEE